jgi:hypothetical protein
MTVSREVGLHRSEAEFHDEWALGTPLDQILVRECCEAPAALENRFILGQMGPLRGKKILDIGSGLGESSVYFALQGALVTAVDIPHYLTPFTCGLYTILLQAMRHLRAWRPGGQPSGLALVHIIPVVCLMLAGLRLCAEPLKLFIPRWPTMWYGTEPLGLPRAHVLAELEGFPGPQLAIVRYAPEHAPFDDWVYNAADIDKSKVVWAREMETGNNLDLLRYFP